MSAADELANYKLQLEQVEAALIAEPENAELLKLKQDLQEVIALQEELLAAEEAGKEPSSSASPATNWRVGDKVLAQSTNGQFYPAIIDGVSGSSASVTFLSNKQELMVELKQLKPAPVQEKSVFDSGKGSGPRKEWQLERERRRLKTLKKEQKRKDLEQAKEGEKTSWLKFNNKATTKGLKGMKRVVASGSAADGPSSGVKRDKEVSSRRDLNAFRATQRGNMESLF